MRNAEVCAIFREMAAIMEILGEDPYRIRAYQRAVQNIENLPEDIAVIAARGELTKIPGIGKELARKIEEILATGTLQKYEELKRKVPPGLVELLQVPGIGPKTAKLLYERLGVKSLAELEQLAKEGKLKGLPGIGAKTEENIRRGIALLRSVEERRPLGLVLPLARAVVNLLREKAPVKRVDLAGSIRRFKETVGDVDILAASTRPEEVIKIFTTLPLVAEVLAQGPTKASVRTGDGLQIDLRVVPPESYGAALCYFTGSKAHNIRVRELAVKQGLKVNEYGVFRGEERIAGATEEEVYAAVGLPYIPPEIREDWGEIEAALEGRLPDLVELKDIKGDFHVHSKYSDGAATLEEIAAEARKLGLEWVAICDHSPALKVAGGLDAPTLLKKKEAIERFNAKSPDVKLLCGVEVDILLDGTLDYPNEVLAQLDVVVAAIHTGLRQSKEVQTKRLLAAAANPYVHAIAHPTGRLLGEREPYELDLEAVFTAAARTGTWLEINAYYKRLDLNDINARAAAARGVEFTIGTDAHLLEQMEFLELGVGVARRAWLTREKVINTLSYEELLARLRAKKEVLGE
ncbi:DNA-directed DNA polymerase [Ammonifex degensii KC4]|uniref:DNA polymerase beta n=1 Tax=Ammonifex degensii (strain DSM 10501 / KC4) TaxID=429009 RepID=C9R9A1_AMMDK|nr:DNA polymerase/3'-5' exonuclease PolX [Ammonifex degensii]ACX52880.1 DNA-directed DNA polymerase [Ammonifex degensii KC4]